MKITILYFGQQKQRDITIAVLWQSLTMRSVDKGYFPFLFRDNVAFAKLCAKKLQGVPFTESWASLNLVVMNFPAFLRNWTML